MVDGKKVYSKSGSLRVTFAGSILPKYVDIENMLFPVRLFVPRVFNCTNCKQLGHTAEFCDNKPRCGKCFERHREESCQQQVTKCAYCGMDPPHGLQECPVYKKRTQKVKRSLVQRSKQSYAEIVKSQDTSATANATAAISAAVQVSDFYNVISIDESDSDVADMDDSAEVHVPEKRKKLSSPGLRRLLDTLVARAMAIRKMLPDEPQLEPDATPYRY
ncbi:uncharacterized protein LOC134225665 [Armigeres subalbatus]|uniref:uncharacterized protein LOC134225665 n=1 Tax=Armigeres subalbatus TaxID=124917 RepID=UPI002ED504C9